MTFCLSVLPLYVTTSVKFVDFLVSVRTAVVGNSSSCGSAVNSFRAVQLMKCFTYGSMDDPRLRRGLMVS